MKNLATLRGRLRTHGAFLNNETEPAALIVRDVVRDLLEHVDELDARLEALEHTVATFQDRLGFAAERVK